MKYVGHKEGEMEPLQGKVLSLGPSSLAKPGDLNCPDNLFRRCRPINQGGGCYLEESLGLCRRRSSS